MVPSRVLTPREEAFCAQYVELGNATQAYKRAFGARPGTKEATHQVKACHKLADPRIHQRVRELLDLAAEMAVCRAAEALREIRRVALSDVGALMSPDGRVLLPHELDPDTAAAVASFKVDEFGRVEYRFWDKNAALEKLARHLGLYERDHLQHTDRLGALLQGLSGAVFRPVDTGEPESLTYDAEGIDTPLR